LMFYPIGLFKKPKANFGMRLSTALQKLGPIYIKFGQTLSTRPDLIGQDIAWSLRELQDRLPPFDIAIVKQMIQEDFGVEIEQLFSHFEQIPVAAASISQVHKATLLSGKVVAVKILRPNIRKIYGSDLEQLHFLTLFIVKHLSRFKRLKLEEVINIFKETMLIELNLSLEAAAASEMAQNFAGDNSVYIPEIYWPLVSFNVMCNEWLCGKSIYDAEGLKAQNLDLKQIATKFAVMFFNQAYRDGFFHADLHPGNILISEEGNIILLDFGITGRLPEKDRFAIGEILLGFLNRDYKKIAEVHKRVGYIPASTNLALFAQSCRAACEPIVGLAIKDISIGRLLTHLFAITESFGMETQPQLLLLQKTMVVVEGIGQQLDPDINMWILAEPWIEKWAAKNLSPEAKLIKAAKKFISNILDKNRL